MRLVPGLRRDLSFQILSISSIAHHGLLIGILLLSVKIFYILSRRLLAHFVEIRPVVTAELSMCRSLAVDVRYYSDVT